jgi:hypothetical protein
MYVQMMSMRIDRMANRATQDDANVKTAMWLVPMLVSDAMRPYMGRRPVVLVLAVVLLPT